ncbi:hypothetical protein EJ08DRAFT_182382 [Tothia fuscella]|uniref:Uncharacterized protein n=1 Tax=Tothia fuscella TaxID=1048955 RepID=A0A9P4TZN9_9PEZI|nr:hypothetical protein EJ08DRAFT_182382 [Tothia fuscella]
MAGHPRSNGHYCYSIYANGTEHPTSELMAELGSNLHQIVDDKFKGQSNLSVESDLALYRAACHNIILADFPIAQQQHVDDALWMMHTKIHGKFRQLLHKIARTEHKRSPTWRAIAKEYTVFIKSSQAAYRQFLRDLDARYPGVTNLNRIAQAFTNGNVGTDQQPSPVFVTQELSEGIIDLTCESLLHLGDLSRWRYVAQLDSNTQSGWKNAAAFYSLAQEVQPASGYPSHQLAVLALADNKVFYALDHLYQAMCARQVHPEAAANLDLLLRKRLTRVPTHEGEVNQLVPIQAVMDWVRPKDENNDIATLRAYFLQLHAMCYPGVEFASHNDIEDEIMWRLTNALKHRLELSSTLFRMVVINIGAEHVAFNKAQADIEPENNARAYIFFVRHNVRTFTALLCHLHEQLEEQSREGVAASGGHSPNIKIPPISDAAMYSIRLYSLWFTQNCVFLQRCTEPGQLEPKSVEYIRNMFTYLAPVLTFIFEQYPLSDVLATGELEYLLREEEATMGFLPLQGEVNKDVWRKEGVLKAVMRNDKSEEQISAEHLVRFRDMFGRGVLVAQDPSSVFILTDAGKILYEEAAPEGPTALFSPTPAQEPEGEPFTPPPYAGDGNIVRLADSTEDFGQYQALWLDGQTDQRGLNPSAPVYEFKSPKPLPSQTFGLNENQIRQILFWTGPLPRPTPPCEAPVGMALPRQLPMVLINAIDVCWMTPAGEAANHVWPIRPFGKSLYPKDGT